MGSTPAARRTVLPIHPQVAPHTPMVDAADPDSSFPPIEEVRPPEGAPNVLIIMLDDAGFGSAATFGGVIDTPTFDRLAERGLRYTRFHTTALCAPTRAALLTGRNHHTVNMGAITEIATSAPGQTSIRPKECAPLAETLRLNGYSTAQFGKCHEVPVWQASPMGPFDNWPTSSGFEHFYGFVGGETNQYEPALFLNTTAIEPDQRPEEGYHLTEDLTDRAIGWLRQQSALVPDKPFFVYFAPGATHAPHHVHPEWSAKYQGRFDTGWDVLREEIFTKQKELGVIPADAELTARHEEIPAWDDVEEEMKPILARQMEVYAGFMEHTDHHVGRLIEAIESLGELDDTLIFCLIGDNGASAEGTLRGTFNEVIVLNGANDLESTEFMAEHIDDFGTPAAFNHYAVGWAHAMNTPYQWTKQVASHWGGTRNGTIVHWPNGIAAAGEMRHQFGHVIDIAPTVLAAAGIPEPISVNGFDQHPYEGFPLNETFDDADVSEPHETQYFEIVVNRGIYHKGWTAVTQHSIPWTPGVPGPPIEDDVWELYAPDDWTQASNIADENPEQLRRLQQLFLTEAARHNAIPLDDRRAERFDSDRAGRPTLIKGDRQILYAGMRRLTENTTINIKNKHHAITGQIELPDGGGSGVIASQGGRFGGWAVYLTKEGRPAYCYNLFGLRRFKAIGDDALQAGSHQVRLEFQYDGGGVGKGGTASLYVDGTRVAETRVDATAPAMFSVDETTDVGVDTASGVTDDLDHTEVGFTGEVEWVEIDIGAAAEDEDHQISPEMQYRIAMSRQ